MHCLIVKILIFAGTLSCLALGPVAILAGEVQGEAPPQVILELRDGSRIRGSACRATLPFQTSLAKMDVSFRQIKRIAFKDDPDGATVSFQNGDRLKGLLKIEAIELETLFGKISIGKEHIVSLKIVRAGTLPEKLLEGLVLHCSFDADDGDRVTDTSGKEHHGEVDGATYLSEGKTGGAYRFDGKAGIHVGDVDLSSGKYTVSGWIRTERAAVLEDWRMWIGQLDGPGNTFQLLLADGRVLPNLPTTNPKHCGANSPLCIVGNGGTGFASLGPRDLNFRDGKWHMVTATCEAGRQKLYADGMLAAESKCEGTLPPSTTDIVIGGINFGPYRHPWIGDIDEVMIFDRVLSAEEIKTLHDSQND